MEKRSLGTNPHKCQDSNVQKSSKKICRGWEKVQKAKDRYAGATQLKYPSHVKDIHSHDSSGLRTAEWCTNFHLDRLNIESRGYPLTTPPYASLEHGLLNSEAQRERAWRSVE